MRETRQRSTLFATLFAVCFDADKLPGERYDSARVAADVRFLTPGKLNRDRSEARVLPPFYGAGEVICTSAVAFCQSGIS
jgi:hypothetical protein